MNKTMTLELVHEALRKVLDYMWKDEQTNWEATEFTTYPEEQPLEGDQHIFASMVLLNKYLEIMNDYSDSGIDAQDCILNGGELVINYEKEI